MNTTVTTIIATARDYFQNGLEHVPLDDIETAFEGETGALEGCSSLSTPAPPEKRSLSFLTKTFFNEICLAKNEIAFDSLRADCISLGA
ncbi:hypothetical protein [Hominenteromicrobium sp.]|uniref:hypothetical protein n=1 Tax=Hominenteromicrobium sp. TaxID=3073581 RepID=UPI003AB4D9D0